MTSIHSRLLFRISVSLILEARAIAVSGVNFAKFVIIPEMA